MILNPDFFLHRYNVVVQSVAIKKKLNQIIKLLLKLSNYNEFRDNIIIDFKSIFIFRQKFNFNTIETIIQYRTKNENKSRINI